MPNSTKSFTYIEVLITLAVVAVLFIPMMQLFSHGLYSATASGDAVTVLNLARWEMERFKNLNFTKAQLKKQGDSWTPVLEEPPLEINQGKWRILRRIKPDSEPLEVVVEVYASHNLLKPLASLATLIEDNIWKESKSEIR